MLLSHTSAAELPYLPVDGSNLLDGSVIWKVYDMSVSDGSANITVNGVSPDDEGKIKLNAENISFNLKDSLGYDIPTSPAISNQNLQDFFTSMQYAIFSVNGNYAYLDPDNPEQVITDITIYGDTMFLESPGSETPMQDWDGNSLSQKTVYDLAVDVYTHSIKEISTDGGETYSTAENGKLNLTIQCPASGWVAGEYGAVSGAYISLTDILDQLSRKSIRTINGMEVYDQNTGDINLTAYDIPLRMVEGDSGNLHPDYTIGEKVYELEYILVPAGTVIAYAGSSAPYGFIACNGAEVSRETYASLFAAIGTLYGEGDGSTTFNLPDLTDRVVQGSATAGTALAAGLPNIKGNLLARPPIANTTSGTGALYYGGNNTEGYSAPRGDSSTTNIIFFDASKSNAIYGRSTTVQPPALTMIYCIKY